MFSVVFPSFSLFLRALDCFCLSLWFPTRWDGRLCVPPSVPPSRQQGERGEQERRERGTVHRKPDTLHHGASHGREHTDRHAAPAHCHCTLACSPHSQLLRLACLLLFAAIPTCVHRAHLHLSLYILGVWCCLLLLPLVVLPLLCPCAVAPAAAASSLLLPSFLLPRLLLLLPSLVCWNWFAPAVAVLSAAAIAGLNPTAAAATCLPPAAEGGSCCR
jgi:hypothetical protein